MSYIELETKIKAFPKEVLEEVSFFVDYIAYREQNKNVAVMGSTKKKGFGCLKDIPCRMTEDFDEPLEEFEEYM